MISAWASSLVAVLGTLSAGALTSFMNFRMNKAQRTDTHLRAQQDAAVTAVADLKKALDRHRAQMWKARNAHHSGQDTSADLDDTHETRSAISEPLTRVLLRIPSLAEVAIAAEDTTYAMRKSTDGDDLEVRRATARAAADALITTAAEQFKAMGFGLALPSDTAPRKTLSSSRS